MKEAPKLTPTKERPMSEATTEVKPRKTYKQREIDRTMKYLGALATMHTALESSGAKASDLSPIEKAAEAIEVLNKKVFQSMPDDFKPAGSAQSSTPEVGDEVTPSEGDSAELYSKLEVGAVVKEVRRLGGNAEGKGAKIFLKIKRTDGSIVVVPSAHFELV